MVKTFRQRIIITNIAILLVFTALITVLFYLQESHALIDYTKENTLSTNRLYSERIGTDLQTKILNLKLVADEVKNTWIYDLPDEDLLIDTLTKFQTTQGDDFHNLLYLTTDGQYKSVDGVSGTVSEMDFYKQLIMEVPEHIISEPFIDSYQNIPIILLVVPILDQDDRLIGAIAGAISLEAFTEELSEVKYRGNSYSWIIDSTGVVLAHPNTDYIMNVNIKDTDQIGYIGLGKIGLEMLSTDSGFGEYYDSNKHEYKTVTYSTIPKTNGWILGITTLKRDIYYALIELITNVLTIALITLILYIMTLWFSSKNMIKPILQLTEAVKASEVRNFTELRLDSNYSEFNQLIRAYNLMTNSIKVYTEDLEHLVDVRTEELNELNQQLDKHNRRLSSLNDELYDMATTDTLTGLLNRAQLLDLVKTFIKDVDLNITNCFTLLFFDLDNFKYYNDTFGHDIGDKLLIYFSDLCLNAFRTTDIVGRYGGDEFLILLPDTNENQARSAVENIYQLVNGLDGCKSLVSEWSDLEHVEIPTRFYFNVSIGSATYTKGSGHSVDSLINAADQAMYHVKKEHKMK